MFLDTLTREFAAGGAVDYDFDRNSPEMNPQWRNDSRAPASGDPYTQTSAIEQ
jgi:hypothetical protein